MNRTHPRRHDIPFPGRGAAGPATLAPGQPGSSRDEDHGTGTRSAVVANPVKVKDGGPRQRQIQGRAGQRRLARAPVAGDHPRGSRRRPDPAGHPGRRRGHLRLRRRRHRHRLRQRTRRQPTWPSRWCHPGPATSWPPTSACPRARPGAVAAATAHGRRRLDVGVVEGPLLHRHGRHGVRRTDAPRHPRDAQGQARLARLRHRRGAPPVRNPHAGQHQPRPRAAVHPAGQDRPGRQRRPAAGRPAAAARRPARRRPARRGGADAAPAAQLAAPGLVAAAPDGPPPR